jgi:acetyl esterase/lipase
MVAFAADYRTKSKHKTEPKACVSDGKSAVRWIRGNAAKLGVDPKKIIAGGGSAGGHVAATTATIKAFDESSDDLSISPKPQALLLFNPVIDNSEKGYGHSRVKEYWKDFSPMHNIKKGIPPTIFICGTKDALIPVATGELFKKKIEKAGGRCDLHWYKDAKHGFFNAMYTETMLEVDKFLVSLGYLEGPATLK